MDDNRDGCFNLARVCRFCLSQAGVMSPIFDNGDPSLPSLAAKIMAFARIQLFMNDGLPTILCHRCLYNAEKAFDFKNQCEASDAMLRKYIAMVQATMSSHPLMKPEMPVLPPPGLCYPNKHEDAPLLYQSLNAESPFKRKRGRPRKEENLIFYSSPSHSSMEFKSHKVSSPNELKMVDGIESLVTVVDPRSDILSNSDEDLKKAKAVSDVIEREKPDADTLRSLAIARAKAKKYMGVLIGVDDNGTKTRRHLCKGCGKTFGHCSDLRKHVLVHTGERPFHCQLCTKTFSRSTNLNKHLKVHSGQKPFTCSNCSKSFATKGDLQRHLVIHSGIKPFSCDLCHQCFSRKDKLTRHVKLHGAPYSTRVNNRSNWTGHSIGVGNEGLYGMNMNFITDEYDPENSKLEEEESSEEPVDSELANPEEESDCKGDVESMVINIDPFAMDGDVQETSSPKFVDSHDGDMANSKKEPPTNIQCGQCQRYFADETELNTHMQTHAEGKPHKCIQCIKSFSRKRELLRHQSVHTGLRPHICPICGKAFARKDKLARHKKIHDGFKLPGKKLFCEICHLGFYKEGSYLEHLESHAPLGGNTDSDEDRSNLENGFVDDNEDGTSDDDGLPVKHTARERNGSSVNRSDR